MANFRCEHIFQLDLQQFVETWYLTVSTIDQAMSRMVAMAQPRANLTARPCKIIGIRCSDVDVRGDSDVTTGLWQASSPSINADFPWTGELIRCAAGTTKRKQMVLRGVPDVETVLPSTKPLTESAAWNLNWGIWRTSMLLSPRFSLQSMAVSIDAPTAVIESVTIDNDSGRVEIQADGHTLQTDDLVEINQVNSTPSINGRWRVVVVDVDTFQLQKSNIGTILYEGNGVVRKVSYTYPTIDNYIDLRKSRRLPGLSRFGVVKGKRARISSTKGGL